MVKDRFLQPDEISAKVNESSALNVKAKISFFNTETTPEFKKKNLIKSSKKVKLRKFKEGKVSLFKYNGAFYVMFPEEIDFPHAREFKQAKGLVTAAYQNELQEKWLSELRSKSKVEIVETILYSAKKYK